MRGTIVLDLDGVLYLDSTGVPGAGEALSALAGDGWHLVYATNNSTKSGEIVAQHVFDRTGFSANPDHAVTSAKVAAEVAAQEHGTAYVIGPPNLEAMVTAAGVALAEASEAEAVIVGLDRALSYEKINTAARAIRRGASFIATNTDATYPTPQGLAPGAGTIVGAIAIASGAEPIVCGKPERPFADAVAALVEGEQVWMVGDRLDTDIAMAKQQGWGTALTLSGVTAPTDHVPQDLTPDVVIDTVADLPRVLDEASRTEPSGR